VGDVPENCLRIVKAFMADVIDEILVGRRVGVNREQEDEAEKSREDSDCFG
jgi:hypothetical protein